MTRRAREARPARSAALLLLVLGVALLVRLQPWSEVFVAGRPGAWFLGDTDPHYHALRAERIAADYPRVPWRDEGMNFPKGADILWPPLFDQAIATGAVAVSGGTPDRATIERVAAVIPVLLGLATVAVVALMRPVLCGGGLWLGPALLLALLPAHVEFTILGRPDQHAAELLLHALAMLAFAAACRPRASSHVVRAWAGALGLLLAVSFWTWQGSAVNLVVLAACTAFAHVTDAKSEFGARTSGALAWGAGFGAVLLLVSLPIWGRPGAVTDMTITGVTGFQVVLCALVAAFGTGLQVAGRFRPRDNSPVRRGFEVAIAAAVPILVAAVVLPGARAGAVQGLLPLTAGNAWYASIREFQPPLFGGAGLGQELAAWIPRFAPLFVMPFAGVVSWRAWRASPEQRWGIGLVLAWGLVLLPLALARKRFTLYLSIPAAIWAWMALRDLAARFGPRPAGRRGEVAVTAAGFAVLVAPALFYFAHGGLLRDPVQVEVVSALEWLRRSSPPDPARPAVFSEWDWGHLVQYAGDRPAVATPFGTDGGEGALQDAAAFFLTTSADEAGRILDRRRAGHVLMVDPLTQAAELAGLAPAGVTSPVVTEWHWLRGPRMVVSPGVDDLVAARLYFDNGMSARGAPTLDRYRLVYEGAASVARQVRLFEVVAGARLIVEGAVPGSEVAAMVSLQTNQGRASGWRASRRADGAGRATLTVPYATGANGAVLGGPCTISGGGRRLVVQLPGEAVARGDAVTVHLRDE